MNPISKERMKEYQKRYIQKHSNLITCDICNKTYKEYRSRYHPFLKRHIKALEMKKNNDEIKIKNKSNNIIVYFN